MVPFPLRVSLLDMLGGLTLVSITIGAVRMLPANAYEDRIYLGAALGLTTASLLLSRSWNGRGVLAATFGATIGGGLTMGLFRTNLWIKWCPGKVNYLIHDSPWWVTIEAAFLAGIIGLLTALVYLGIVWMCRRGPGGVLKFMRVRPIRSSLVLIVAIASASAIWMVDRIYLGGGIRPFAAATFDGQNRLPARVATVFAPIVSEWRLEVAVDDLLDSRTSVWMASTTPWRLVNEFSPDKCHEFQSFYRPQLSPDKRYFLYWKEDKSVAIAATATGKTISRFDEDCNPPESHLKWLDNQKIAMQQGQGGETNLSVWAFDGRQVNREQTIRTQGDGFPVAFSPDLQWIAEVAPAESSNGTEYVVTRVADGRELYRTPIDYQEPGWNEDSSLTASPDARWLYYNNQVIDVARGEKVFGDFYPYPVVGFTSNSLLLTVRTPYCWPAKESSSTPEMLNSDAALFENQVAQPDPSTEGLSNWQNLNLIELPFWRLLDQLQYCEQIVAVDLATGKQVARFHVVNGTIGQVAVSSDGGHLLAVVSGFQKPRFCGLEKPELVDSMAMAWELPAECRLARASR